jgi:hypothetical protein
MSRLARLGLQLRCWSCFVGCRGREEGGEEKCLGQRFASRDGQEGGQEEGRIRCGLGRED